MPSSRRALLPALLALVLSALLTAPASAQLPTRGEISLAFEPNSSITARDILLFSPFQLYLGATGVGEISAWEARLGSYPSTGFGALTVLGVEYSEPDAVNIALADNYVVGLGTCANYSYWTALATYTVGYFGGAVPTDGLVCAEGIPGTFPPIPPPSFTDCSGQLFGMAIANRGFGIYPDGCVVVNATQYPPIATEATSFGRFKGAAHRN